MTRREAIGVAVVTLLLSLGKVSEKGREGPVRRPGAGVLDAVEAYGRFGFERKASATELPLSARVDLVYPLKTGGCLLSIACDDGGRLSQRREDV